MSSETSTTGLVVPVNVVAFCVGEIDEEATSEFAGVTTVYTSQVTEDHNAYLGFNVTRPLNQYAYNKLKKGVHIHWALPDALTKFEYPSEEKKSENGLNKENKSENDHDKKLVFKAVPNRWLLTRIIVDNGTVKGKSWIIESDALSPDDPNGNKVTLPLRPSTKSLQASQNKKSDKDFNYVGRFQEFTKDWKSSRGDFLEKTGFELSAISSGVVSFASYYPDCNTVFGFWDDLKDISVHDKTSINLIYVLTGWYDNPEKDPLHSLILSENGNYRENMQELLEKLQKQFKWTFEDRMGLIPSYTVYSGLVEGITWNPKTSYIYHQPSQLSLKAKVAIGNNPAEAISAYFKNRNQLEENEMKLFESLLNAFQMGLLNDFQDPQPNRLEQLYESLHKKKFTALDSGSIYTIVRRDDASCDSDQEEMIDLPPKLADDLNCLNLLQQQSDCFQSYLKEYRLQLFFDWYRIFMATQGDTRNNAYSAALNKINKYTGDGESKSFDQISQELDEKIKNQIKLVNDQFENTFLKLKQIPAPRFYQPSEPVVLIESDELKYPSRYGGDGRFDNKGFLKCRLTEQTLTEVTVNNIPVAGSKFDNLVLPEPNGLLYSELCSKLLKEACLMNPSLIASITRTEEDKLIADIKNFLEGKGTKEFQVAEEMPSPTGVTWWNNGNPWLPLFVCWQTDFLPLNKIDDVSSDYPVEFFTDNYEIEIDHGGYVAYSPGTGSHSIHLDPSLANSNQKYTGEALLQPTSAKNFADQLTEYLQKHKIQVTKNLLQDILDQLKTSSILVQPLSGFSSSLLMRQHTIQLQVGVPEKSKYTDITDVLSEIQNQYYIGPDFNGCFNPLRAGNLKNLKLQVIDVFGQRRNVDFSESLICAESMIAYDAAKKPVPSVAYFEPRISQPARLLFRWISADSTGYEEMNSHPATSSICGWLLPDHLNEGFFIYNQQGKPLGSLHLNGEQTKVEWQSAPGDDSTINESIEEALKHENPQLKNLSVTLKSKAAFFKSFWNAVDLAHGSINPQNLSSSSGLAVLIGRPVALVQAMLRLEVEGSPALNQSWYLFTQKTEEFDSDKVETDNGFSNVQFPVILGDQSQLDDGLIGYFKTDVKGGDYDYSTFYVEGTDSLSGNGVVRPDKTNLLVTVAQKVNSETPQNLEAFNQKILMLVDPRASVNATTGILPTKSLDLPSDLCDSALSILEMSFPVAPILEGASGLSLPIPQENGYQFSWIEEDKANAKNRSNGGTVSDSETGTGGSNVEWVVKPDIQSPTDKAIWAYTPQRIKEGWLRMNPLLLEFMMVDAKNNPVVTRGQFNSMTLVIVNKKHSSIKFTPGSLVEEEKQKSGSIFYIHLGDLVDQKDIDQIQFSAENWTFQKFKSNKYGQYWAAVPTKDIILNPFTPEKSISKTEYSFTISVTNLMVSARGAQSQVYFDYYNVDGLNDGVYMELLTVQSS